MANSTRKQGLHLSGAELLIARDVGLVIVTLVDALETAVDSVNRFAARARRGPRTAH